MAYGLLIWIVMVAVMVVLVSVARRSFADLQSLVHALAFSSEKSCARIALTVNEFFSRGIADASIHAQLLGTYRRLALCPLLIRCSTTFACCHLHLCCFRRAQQSSAGMYTLLTACWQPQRLSYSAHRLHQTNKGHGNSINLGSTHSCFSASRICRDSFLSLRVNSFKLPRSFLYLHQDRRIHS
jgi:hypothetical protein